MHGLGDDFLASSALALQQHRRATGCHLRDQVENLQHGLALAHDVFKVVALLQGPLELNVFFFGPAPANGGTHIGQQLFVVPRFLYEVGGAGLHRVHGIFHRSVGSDHDDGQPLVVRMELRENIHTIAARER